MVVCLLCFFFFKQKTAYEMRISDWSSDVCSSDLAYSVESLADPGRGAMRSVLSLLLAIGIALMMLHQLGALRVFNGWLIAYGFGLALPLLMLARIGMRFVTNWALQNHPVSELVIRSEAHTSELTSLMRISYAV